MKRGEEETGEPEEANQAGVGRDLLNREADGKRPEVDGMSRMEVGGRLIMETVGMVDRMDGKKRMEVEMVMEVEVETEAVNGLEWENQDRDKVEAVMVEAVEWGERAEVVEVEVVELETVERHTLEARSEETVIAKYAVFLTL